MVLRGSNVVFLFSLMARVTLLNYSLTTGQEKNFDLPKNTPGLKKTSLFKGLCFCSAECGQFPPKNCTPCSHANLSSKTKQD